jgi:hypothetical protein
MRTRLSPTLLGAGFALAVVAVPAHAANDIEATAQLCAVSRPKWRALRPQNRSDHLGAGAELSLQANAALFF